MIPTRDRNADLCRCLAAVAGLEGPSPLQVIVVDDGGREPLAPVLERAGGRLALVSMRTRGEGPAVARNAGARAAEGELVVFLDDDCAPEPGWLAALVRRAEAEPGTAVGGRTANTLERDRSASASQVLVDVIYEHYNADPSRAQFLTSNNLCFPGAAFRELGGFDQRFPVAGGEDRDICRRWLETGRRLVFEPAAVVRHFHALGPGGFLRQQFGYGRGAWLERRARAARGGGFRLDPALTSGIFGSAMRVARSRRDPSLAMLLVGWQLANAAGFAAQAVRTRWP
ncbi:MAG: glycosyltransferase [Solirubrobacterales bacterium]|nr:glycosyltransferase [Solirubrobacterales bacterium]